MALVVSLAIVVFRQPPQPPIQPTTLPATLPAPTAEPPRPTATAAPATWSAIQLGDWASLSDSGVDGMALAETWDEAGGGCTITTITAIDLDALTVLWTRQGAFSCQGVTASPEGIVAVQYPAQGAPHVQVIDAVTGAVTAEADLTVGETVMEVGGGIIYSQTDTTGCARDMTLGSCLWQAPANPLYPRMDSDDSGVGAFGNYSWVNAGDGVRDGHTGAAAPFGSDGSMYVGPTRDRVLKVISPPEEQMLFQLWNTVANAPVAPATSGAGDTGRLFTWGVSFSPVAPVFLVHQDGSSEGTDGQVTGYSWDTGQQVFSSAIYLPPRATGLCYGHCVWLTGTTFWSEAQDPKGPTNPTPVAAMSLTTGATLWQQADAQLVGVTSQEGQDTIYVFTASRLTALNAATAEADMTIGLPPGATSVWVAGNRVVATAYDGSNTYWVLNR